jgi:hypothetical protein
MLLFQTLHFPFFLGAIKIYKSFKQGHNCKNILTIFRDYHQKVLPQSLQGRTFQVKIALLLSERTPPDHQLESQQ